MLSATSIPMWIAIIAAISSIFGPVIQGYFTRRSPQSRADAAEKFTSIASTVAEDNHKLREDLRILKESVLDLVILMDSAQWNKDTHPEIHEQLLVVKRRMYGMS